MSDRTWRPVLVLVCVAFGVAGLGLAGEDIDKPTMDTKKAGDKDVSKKAFKKAEGGEPPALSEVGYVRRAKIDLMAALAGSASGSLPGGSKVTVTEDKGEWVKVTAESGAAGYVKKEDLRKKAPVVWHSNREDIQYQECLGKDCEGKKAKKVDKKDELLEIDRGGPDNAFIFVEMPGGVYGWVPVPYMREWREKFD